MRVLITGGAGFIGSHIVDQCLAKGWQPFVVDNLSTGVRQNIGSSTPFFEVDICDARALSRVFDDVRPDIVCHQAAQMSVSRSVREPTYDAQVNILGLIQVLSESVRVGVKRVVFASSGGVLYGDVTTPAPEETPPAPISPYGIAKLAGEHYLQFYVREYGVDAVALRYGNVYGPRQNPHGEAGVVAIFCQRLLAGQPATVNGDGKYVRDYVYVDDVAKANVLSMERPLPAKFVPINIGTGLPNDTNVLGHEVRHEIMAELTRRRSPTIVPELLHGPARAGDLRSNLVSPAKAQAVLGWKADVAFAEGLKRTVRWFAEHAAGT